MDTPKPLKTFTLFILLIALVVGLSMVSNRLWGGRPEKLPGIKELKTDPEMTVSQFGQANDLPNPVLKEIFGLKIKADLDKKLREFADPDQIQSMVAKKLALAAEKASKNWLKIPVKFGAWFVFLAAIFILFKKRKVTPALRKWILFAAVLIFGVVLGADPGPMGTVKDAIYLYGSAKAVFPPRMIALAIFLAIVFLANKYICAWGCQAGVLQDLIFRLNQTDSRQRAVIGRQIKLPFAITNAVRMAFFCLFTVFAFMWGIDVIDPVDPFKIFKPAALAMAGAIFIAALLLASLFVYRPWCHLFCPFGLVGWMVEKISRVKISVNYDACIACMRCADACPSTVMSAILKQDKKTIPDCFACYACRDICPTNSIRFSTQKRTLPPTGHFGKRSKSRHSRKDAAMRL